MGIGAGSAAWHAARVGDDRARIGPGAGVAGGGFREPHPDQAEHDLCRDLLLPGGQGAWDQHGVDNGVTNGPLTAPAGGRSAATASTIAEMRFRPAITRTTTITSMWRSRRRGDSPYLILSFNPPNPSITTSTPLGSVVATIIATLERWQPVYRDAVLCAIDGKPPG